MPLLTNDKVIEQIGNTPLLRLAKLERKGSAAVFGKAEFFNPGGSIKDRICLAMIESAERDGTLKPGATVVEPTSGNTGIGLSMICAVKGYKLILTMPDTMTVERRRLLAAYGAELILTPGAQGMRGAVMKAEELAAQPGHVMMHQFKNPANPDIHRRTTGPEIVETLSGTTIDAFVAGVGTGGTITGVGEVLRKHNSSVRVVAVEPADSPVLSGGQPGPHKIQGIGAGFIPDVLNTKVYDEIITVSNDDAYATVRNLAREEGILVGISSGANVFAALQVAAKLGPGKNVVTILCDTGERYLSTGVFD
ncbi:MULTISPECIES: cysteine synthase A [Geobacter]|uniref:cysteine synthase A n=1 Tax=Geobacter TaxID=28231 RepID=UPI002574114A|nr:cysteine synthase A [Geobacter sulfurreducens]BEH09068.1 cysteine synthase A [Geobacter sulfurreducens subsp. ethanolicus]BET60388.1 cysteine synthase A [Geobacter sp. 60473]